MGDCVPVQRITLILPGITGSQAHSIEVVSVMTGKDCDARVELQNPLQRWSCRLGGMFISGQLREPG